jgi:molybdopterin/thiamine biosynthesis adenylyltransferase/rhodanese-related sulfurtransferase
LGTVYVNHKDVRMLSQQEQARYSRQIMLPELGREGQEKLKEARVLVIGAGGLGCPILQYLTATGVGTLGIVDGDTVSMSNLQRQVLYTEQEIEQKKAEIAANKLKNLNPNVKFEVFPVFLDATNILEIISAFDLIVDGSDNFSTRYLVNDACVIADKPFISGAIYKFEGQLSVFNYKGGPTYRCLFPDPPAPEESPSCADIGVVATLPGIIGSLQANEAIKIITQTGGVLSGRLMTMNVLDMSTYFFNFNLVPANKTIHSLLPIDESCAMPTQVVNISYDDLVQQLARNASLQLVDVREEEEHQIVNIGGVNIPLSQFEARSAELTTTAPVVLYCASGARSNHFAKRLLEKGFTHVMNLENGINHLNIN